MAAPKIEKINNTLYNCSYDPLPRQKLLHATTAKRILYGGAMGGAKSTALRWDAYTFALNNPRIRCFLFRRTLKDLLKNHVQNISYEIPTSLAIYNKADSYLQFTNESRVYMCHFDGDEHWKNYIGQEMHWLGVDEATTFDPKWLNQLISRVRISAEELKDFPDASRLPRVIFATNPQGGAAHAYVKEIFVDQSPPEIMFKDKYSATEEDWDSEGNYYPPFEGFDTIYIPSRMLDNPHLPPEYRAQFNRFPPELRRAYVDGDWEAVIGAALHTLSRDKHCLPQFKILDKNIKDPVDTSHWTHFMSMDYGTASPSSIGWYCITDRWVEFTDTKTGKVINVPPDSVIRFAEWYTAEDEYEDRGMRLPSEAIARGILQREQEWGLPQMDYRVGDSQMWAEQDGPSQMENMAKHGVMLRKSVKGKAASYDQILSRLAGNPLYKIDGETKHPTFYVTEGCKMWWKLVPGLVLDPVNPDDGPMKKGQPVHAYDETVYALMSRPYMITAQERQDIEMQSYRERYLEARGESGSVDPYFTG